MLTAIVNSKSKKLKKGGNVIGALSHGTFKVRGTEITGDIRTQKIHGRRSRSLEVEGGGTRRDDMTMLC